MTDDTILSHAEALAEIKRLRARNTDLEAVHAAYQKSLSCRSDQLFEMLTQRTRLETRITELEAAAAITHGTLEQRLNTQSDPYASVKNDINRYTHNVPPNAPPHNE
jgi:chromosome segregation ATPase